MKILFVCKSNIGRSQIAEAFFNEIAKNHEAISAGIDALDFAGRKIEQLSEKAIRCMLEKGIDISKKLAKQLTEELAKQGDFVVWLAPEEDIPSYLKDKKLILWNVEDAGGKPYETWCCVRDEIKNLVDDLIAKMENSQAI